MWWDLRGVLLPLLHQHQAARQHQRAAWAEQERWQPLGQRPDLGRSNMVPSLLKVQGGGRGERMRMSGNLSSSLWTMKWMVRGAAMLGGSNRRERAHPLLQ